MGVTYLLDTHVLLWLLGSPGRVKAELREELQKAENRLVVSAASAFEIAQKTRVGKLAGEPVLQSWSQLLQEARILEIPLTGEDMILAGALSWDHRDPFDRMIVSHAIRHRAQLVTADRVVLSAGLVRTVFAEA
ncbi:type II toxin-antitoxin system VapC family toxin [Helcobacillus massiliensis]|uniref:type II toxin-antitoxin system VapC family toxin n=1 Tax=Helcobacillus massiliensis TaxID=521392 RepID=UPI0021A8D714|nr:type II toxin-antitoxin system VapC family toxin [Helcobacillus massiliensis]MCT1558503.1 type II toxin-antitoxin system VapC family toxin [Helcobacillus massiliensis]